MPDDLLLESPTIDFEAINERYRRERDKRLRQDGETQYVEVNGEYAHYHARDPYTPFVARDPIAEEIDVAILGGGFAGLLAAAHVKQQGVDSLRIIEMAGDFGGAWYWNRYPGAQCDIESYCYLPLLEELNYIPKEKYSYQPEIYEQCRRIGRHYALYDVTFFGTRATAITWDARILRWRIATDRGDEIKARFVIMAVGAKNRAKLPGIPGLKTFKGHTFHTSRWDYAYTGGDHAGGLVKLADKRIGIIGTGASGIQCIPYLAQYAKHLYVFQRTPSSVDSRRNRPTDPAWARSLKPGWQRERQQNYTAVTRGAPAEKDLVCDGWTDMTRTLSTMPREGVTSERIAEMMLIAEYKKMQELRDRVDHCVKDRQTAELLKAWYRYWCKRPTFNDAYLPTFNRDNVTLVDVSATKGVERITEKGLVGGGAEYEVDCIIYASGFEITTEMSRRIGITPFAGRGGLSLYDHWRNGFKTLHGFMTSGFPNLLFTGFTQGASSPNLGQMLDVQTRHIAYIIKEATTRGVATVEPTEAAQREWSALVIGMNVASWEYKSGCTPGYYNNEGTNAQRSHAGDVYMPGLDAFSALLDAWRREGDMKGLVLRW